MIDLIGKTAKLARIRLSTEEAASFGKQLDEVLTLFDALKGVDVSGVEPLRHPFSAETALRPDVPRGEEASLRPYLTTPSVAKPTMVDETGQYEVVAIL